jgi:hypothetical protein
MSRYLFAKKGQKGFVTIYMVFAFLTLIPMAGLAIDLSVLYNVKGKLQAACDAAAIGAGVQLQRSTSMSDPTSIANIKDATQRFFNANYNQGYWGSSAISYSSTPSEDVNTKVRTIVVTAAENVPMLFLRVVGVNNSQVAASATISVRFVTMEIVVDRSGSVQRGGADTSIKNALTTFVANASTSYLVDGRDEVGMFSFGATTEEDLPLATNFRSGSPKNISTAISGLPFNNNPTNTVDGLYYAYQRLKTQNETGALNVIVLLTDGRPSAFTATLNIQTNCTTKGNRTGVITANVGTAWPPLPPQSLGSGINIMGLFIATPSPISGSPLNCSSSDMCPVTSPSNTNCHYAADNTTLYQDIATFPGSDVHGNSLTGPVYQGEGQSLSDPRAVRYASFNAADNQATLIRQDTVIRPVLFVIGLNEPTGEPLDEDWLARVANDPGYKDSNGNSVVQAGQTNGMYFNVTASGLAAAFQEIASQILRLSH